MIKVLETYSFMDLLKDYNYVPAADQHVIQFPENIASLVEYFTDMVKGGTTDYDFMDLLGDNGYVPVNDNWVKTNIDDYDEIIKIAS